VVPSHLEQIVYKTLSWKYLSHTKKGLAEWLKVKALSSSSSTAKKKKINTLFLREKPKSFIIEDDVNFSMMPFSVWWNCFLFLVCRELLWEWMMAFLACFFEYIEMMIRFFLSFSECQSGQLHWLIAQCYTNLTFLK
jgi:hypothetical protein